MSTFTDNAVLEMFRDLPGHRGCADGEFDAIESRLGIKFPGYYRRLMSFDSDRLINTGMILPLSQIRANTIAEIDPLDGEPPIIVTPRIVFAVDDIRAIFAMDCLGSDDSPVYEFDHYNADEDSQPIKIHDTLAPFFADILRVYLGLR
ncbi:hypothetical protein Mal15_48040 [Stieleria maiorica]|uniref:Knr4/Smi1-like domain-containing protein n=1 Tax=Stieleria maiorica TaxID=2795974 RepID=A0A5B9MHH2_9BACT|nr:SMI1/KNR4 family protein [Stieleria maiorica]QEG00732.1 hypothetical protein Mal15_48040 [Stieleria maiorica]